MLQARRLTVVVGVLFCLARSAGAQPVVSGSKLRTDCATNDLLKWNGTTWVCSGGPAVTGSGAANVVAKWTSAFVLGQSLITDDGTKVGINGVTDTDYALSLRQLSAFTTGKLTHAILNVSATGMTMPNTSGGLPTVWTTYGGKFVVNPQLTGACTGIPEVTQCDNQTAYGVYGDASPTAVGDAGLTAYGGYFTATASSSGAGQAYGVYATASGSSGAYSIYADAGNVFLNADGVSTTVVGGNTTLAKNVTLGTGVNSTVTTRAWGDHQQILFADTNSRTLGSVVLSGTADTSSGPITEVGLNAASLVSRSAGANPVTNIAMQLDALGGQSNYALKTFNGDISLMSVGTGKWLFAGENSTYTDSFAFRGSFSTSFAGAGKTADGITQQVNGFATYDTTAAARNSYAMLVSNTSSRSAGSNNLTNYAIKANSGAGQINYGGYFTATGAGTTNTALYANASGATTNIAFQTDAGSVLLNQTSGATGIGTTPGTNVKLDVNGGAVRSVNVDNGDNFVFGTSSKQWSWYTNGGQLRLFEYNTTMGGAGNDRLTVSPGGLTTIKLGTSTAQAAVSGTTFQVDQVDGNSNYITLRGTSIKGINFANTSGSQDGSIQYDNAARGMYFITSGTARNLLDSNGTAFYGDTSSTAIASNVDVVSIGQTGTGQTTSGKSLVTLSNTGSYDGTAGALSEYGLKINVAPTRSAGANTVTSYGLYIDSATSTGVSAYALFVNSGAVQLSSTTINGNFTVNSGSLVTIGSATSFVNGNTTSFDGPITAGNDANDLVTFSTGPKGINNYAGKHLEWSTEAMNGALNWTGNNVPFEGDWWAQTTGTGAQISSTNTTNTGRPGVWDFSTGSTASGLAHVYTNQGAIDFTIGDWKFGATVAVDAASALNQDYLLMIGFSDHVTGGRGCYFVSDRLGSIFGTTGTNWAARCIDGAGNATFVILDGTTNGGFATTACAAPGAVTWPNTNVQRLEIVETGSSVAFKRNGTTCTTITGASVPGAGETTGTVASIGKESGTTARHMYVDQIGFEVDLTSARSP